MWWIDRFGSVSGPYSDEQVRRGIQQNRFTRLHKISSDRRNWSRLGQSAFWNLVQGAPTPLDLPSDVTSGENAHVVPEEPCPTPSPVPSAVSDAAPVGNSKTKRLAWCGVGCACGVVAVFCFFVSLALLSVDDDPRELDEPQTPAVATESSSSQTQVPQKVSPDDFEAIKKCVVLVRTESGSGTAFLVKMDGKKYVLTNDHVIRGKTTPKMTFVDGTELTLGNLSIARDRDLARFEVMHDGASLELSAEAPNNNDPIWIYGNSMGDGVITTLRGFVTGVGSKVLKVNAEIVGGNSGSPILGEDGKVLGVAAYLQNGDHGKDWTTKGTSFDSVRRFGLRLTNVKWVSVDRRLYERDCGRLETFKIYWNYLVPYCIVEDVSDEERAELKLAHQDLDRKNFGKDERRFHEMLMAVSAAYAEQGRCWRRWASLLERRGSLIKDLDEDIRQGKLTREAGENVLNEFDQNKKVDAKWEDLKSKCRDFNAKRKEALLLARTFLTEVEWQDPLMRHGYGEDEDDRRFSVDWYQRNIQELLDCNAQKLKNLNKDLKRLESGDDEE